MRVHLCVGECVCVPHSKGQVEATACVGSPCCSLPSWFLAPRTLCFPLEVVPTAAINQACPLLPQKGIIFLENKARN